MLNWLVDSFERPYREERERAAVAAAEYWLRLEATPRAELDCDLCAGRVKLFCPYCYKPIDSHSHEGDYICEVHEFVVPVTEESLRALKARLETLA